MSDSYRPHGLQPTRLLRPWDLPGKSAGVGAIAFSRKYSQCLLKIFATVSCGEETCARGRKWGFTGVSAVKKLPASAADTGPIPVGKVPGEGVAAHSSVLAWRVPWAEGAVGLQPTGSHSRP